MLSPKTHWAVCCLCIFGTATLHAGVQAPDALGQMTEALQALTRKVSPAVVKILVAGYGAVAEKDQDNAAMIVRQHSVGSGVVVSPDGYIITNAHVVRGAERIRVAFVPPNAGALAAAPKQRILAGQIVGVDKDHDLAVLKVEASGLPTIRIGDYHKLRQGQLVLAFGSPEGLENSVSMGLISSVLRQPDPDEPNIYIQTDAAINPGNSGGPLVDVEGNLVGINTFILSESGGSEGIGFAIPTVVVNFVYREIRTHGHVHRPVIGANIQAVTPALAAGLKLPQQSGVIFSDVAPDGPAGKAGVEVQDILLSVDGVPIESLPMFEAAMYRREHEKPISIRVQRGPQKLTMTVPVVETQQHDYDDLADLVKPEKSLVRGLGILGIEINDKIASMIDSLRIDSGVIVAALAASSSVSRGLQPGDIIHSLNGTPIRSLEYLRSAVNELKPGDAAALQIERDGTLMYIAFEME